MKINFEERGTKGTRNIKFFHVYNHRRNDGWIIQYIGIIIIEKVVRKKKMCQLPGGAVKRDISRNRLTKVQG